MKHSMINSFFLLLLVAIAGLQVSHAIRGHAIEDKIIKTVTDSPNIVQNLGDGWEKDWVAEIVVKYVAEEFKEELEEREWTIEDITPETTFYFFRYIDMDDLIDMKLTLRDIFEETLHVKLTEEFDNMNLTVIETIGDLVSAVRSVLPKPKAN